MEDDEIKTEEIKDENVNQESAEQPSDKKDERKEKLNAFGEKVREIVTKGVDASKRGLDKAGKELNRFGEKSSLQIEKAQYKSKLTKLQQKAGEWLIEKFNKENATTVDSSDEALKQMLEEAKSIEEKIAAFDESIAEFKKKWF